MPLAEPPHQANSLADVPSKRLPRRVFRVWRHDHPDGTTLDDPWWFASVGDDPEAGGRFDLPAPMGTMHTATSPVGAVLEALQGHLAVLPIDELRVRRLAAIDVPADAPEAADLTDPAVVGRFGVTAALWAGASRALSHAWAFALRRDGWWSLHTGLQHDPTGSLRAVAVFGPAGDDVPTLGGSAWGHTATSLHDDDVLVGQLGQHGVIVRGPGELDVPNSVPGEQA